MKVLVTGGAGFIGSHIVDALLDGGHEVAVVDNLSTGSRENVSGDASFFEADIRDGEAIHKIVREFRPQWVSHQAAQMSVSRSVREPAYDAHVNLVGLCNVLSAAVEVGVSRVVFASSGGVMYGDVSSPADESYPANPISPYGISKWAGERYLQFFTKEHGVTTLAMRYANVYGPRQNPLGEAGVVAIFSTRMLAGETATINGDGKYIRDYVHVGDVVAANLAALTAPLEGFHAYNVGTGRPTDVNDLAALVAERCRHELSNSGSDRTVPAPVHGPARAGDLRSNLVSAEKARRELGWQPKVSIEDGLAETVHWFFQQLNAGRK